MNPLELPVGDSVLIAIISGPLMAIFSAIGAIGKEVVNTRKAATEVKADTKATRYQVENHHTTNLREDNDNKHEELKFSIGEIKEALGIVVTSIAHLNTRMDGHMDRANNQDRRIERLESRKHD